MPTPTVVREVIEAFSAEGRAFVVVNAQQDVDISHESFIRNWTRLRQWVEEENRSRRIYTKLADVAASWAGGAASLYRGPELAEARRWWAQERPTQVWANRYDPRFDVAERFLTKSVRAQLFRRGLIAGNAAVLLLGAIAIAVLMSISRAEARRAEAEALAARTSVAEANTKFEQANAMFQQAIEAQKQGRTGRADELVQEAQLVTRAASAAPVLTQSELTELDRLRKEQADRERTERDLRQQLAAARGTPSDRTAAVAGPEPAELERLRRAESTWERDNAQLRQQLSAATEQAAALKRSNDDLQARTSASLPAAAPRSPRSSACSTTTRRRTKGSMRRRWRG